MRFDCSAMDSAEMPTVTPGPYYPGIDDERAGILPDRVQTVKKDIMDIDVDEVGLDESLMCNADDYFNTSATPMRNATDTQPIKTHYPPTDPTVFDDLPPVEIDPVDLEGENGFDYNFDESSEAGPRRHAQERAP